mmetsp:Transcript_23347/g.54067  ORF Transcript_23347/g.54067 Transcript_23347/m.54067 type:complete len:246 (-) Transcript_23347:1386-2123(-)
MVELRDEEVASRVRLLRLCVDEEVAIEQVAEVEVDPCQQRHEGGDGAEDHGDEEVDREAGAPGAHAVVVLVFGLGQHPRILLAPDLGGGDELGHRDVAGEDHSMHHPLERQEVQVVVGRCWHLVCKDHRKLQRILCDLLNEVHEVLTHNSHANHEEDHEPKIPILQLELRGDFRLEVEKPREDVDQDRGREREENQQAEGGRVGCPQRLERTQVDGGGEVCDEEAERREGNVESEDQAVTDRSLH